MKIGSWTKLIVCVLVIVSASLLCYWGKIEGEAAVALITAVLGYVFGNGHGILEQKTKNKGGNNVNG